MSLPLVTLLVTTFLAKIGTSWLYIDIYCREGVKLYYYVTYDVAKDIIHSNYSIQVLQFELTDEQIGGF